MSEPILITGATGNVGAEVVRLLATRGRDVRAAVRNPERLPELPAGAHGVEFDFSRPETFEAALKGVRRVFFMRPPHISDASVFDPFLLAMKAADVEQVVFLSLLGVERNPVVPHHAIEKRLKASGLGWTMLRPGFYMQNLSTTHLADIRDRGEIVVPAGMGRTSLIDACDIAHAAVAVLTQPGHVGRGYSLTGSEALTYEECAQQLSQATGRAIRYTRPSGRAFARHMEAQGHDREFVKVMRGIYLVAKLRMAGTVTDELSRLIGRRPTTFAEFAERNAALFMPQS